MNYEQKYNEALQKAKEEYNRLGKLGNESMKQSFEIIFPELAESKDERIRKTLIEELSACNTVGELKFRLPAPTREECITWLEKQKEHWKPSEEQMESFRIVLEREAERNGGSKELSLANSLYEQLKALM